MRLPYVLLLAGLACSPPADGNSFVITNARIIDGTGAPGLAGSVRVRDGLIADVGSVTPARGEQVVDAGGLVLAPGFIDTHSHADGDLREDSTALAAVTQGITTIIGGQDGASNRDLTSWFADLEARPAPLNVASYVGHGSLRARVMGDDYKRVATAAEVDSMRAMLETELAAGALGLSTGLEYDPGIYSSGDEVLTLARATAAAGGRYISHVRSEDFAFWKAIDEIIAIGREARLPVQVSHIKLAMRDLWGRADSLIRVLDAARASGVDVTADIYPYLYWQSTITVLFPKRNFESREAANFALTQTTTPGGLLLATWRPNPKYEGMTLAQVAAERGVDSVTALIDLIRDSERMEQANRSKLQADHLPHEPSTADSTDINVETIIATSMVEEDVAPLMTWAHTNFCTDGSLTGSHPRSFGSYPRILGHYVRELEVMSLETAVHKASQLAARHVGLKDRGTIATGQAADLVLFDPATIIDKATPKTPHEPSVGVSKVWVNGVLVLSDGVANGARAGKVLRRS